LSVFVDTSAWYALASVGDQDHRSAQAVYRDLVERKERLVTTSYALAETMGLIQRRLGWRPLELFAAATHTVDVVWIDRTRHREAETLLFARRRRAINIVDAASFVVMKALGIEDAFAFDEDYRREGFHLLKPGRR
jgi:predicted nucleic acid-binding protein